LIEEFSAHSEDRENGEEDDDNSHAADPLQKTPPEEKGFTDCFDARVEDEPCLRIADRSYGSVINIGFFRDVRIVEMDGNFSSRSRVVGFWAKHGGSCGREARHRFKIGVKRFESAAKSERERTDDGSDDPNEDDKKDALSPIELVGRFTSHPAENHCQEKANDKCVQKSESAVGLRMDLRENLIKASKRKGNEEEGA